MSVLGKLSNFGLRASLGIAMGIAAGASVACEPRVSVGDNSDHTDLGMTFVPKASDNPIFDLSYHGAWQATVDLGIANGRNVVVDNLAPPVSTLDAQKAKVQAAISKGTRGLIVSCVDTLLSSTINDAVDKGIPVITFDSDCPDSKRLAFYGTDNTAAGAEAADLLASALNETGGKRVGILSGRVGADNLDARVRAFEARLNDKYPTLELENISNCDETSESCKTELEDEIAQFADLDGLFVVGLWGVQAACDCESASNCACNDVQSRMPNWYAATQRGLRTVAFDALPFELQLMKQGYLSALIGQKYYEWGYETVTSMFKYLTRGEPVSFTSSSYDIVVNQEDVDTMMSNWQKAEK